MSKKQERVNERLRQQFNEYGWCGDGFDDCEDMEPEIHKSVPENDPYGLYD